MRVARKAAQLAVLVSKRSGFFVAAREVFSGNGQLTPDGSMTRAMFAMAIGYAINQRGWLKNIFLDGRLAISNNLAESSIRPFTIGRNSRLFSFSAKGADASAMAYGLDYPIHEYCKRIEHEINNKFEAMEKRTAYTQSKIAPTESEREEARQKYLDLAEIHKDFRYSKDFLKGI